MFSSLGRNEIIANISKINFDLIIIGGGITGAGIALDAASRGMKVLLVEKNDFASGTSSKSTKLIHGGLRYLKQMEFALVRQVGTERAVIHKLAPHLVLPINMLLPIYKTGSLGKYTTSLALWLYDLLAKVKTVDRYKMLGPKQVEQREPLLATNGLIGGALYKEYRTDDARLTIEILKTASAFGAVCLNYIFAEKFLYEKEILCGIVLHDSILDKTIKAFGKKVVNATGPWVDDFRSLDGSTGKKKLHLTKGIHIVISSDHLPLKNAVYFDADDGRMIFAIPRSDKIYIGTTDTTYQGDRDHIEIEKHDIDYLLHAVNNKFSSANLNYRHIESMWAGLRPLIHKEGKSPAELSRKDEIFISRNGLISIAGGKLTGYRKMAEKVVDIVASKLKNEYGQPFPKSKTKNIQISGSDFQMPIERYIDQKTGEAKQIGLNRSDISYLVDLYGNHAEIIIDKAYDLHREITDPRKRFLKAELQYCVENEMVTNINDFLIRRTARLYFDRPSLESEYKIVAELLSEILSLTPVEKDLQIQSFESELKALSKFE